MHSRDHGGGVIGIDIRMDAVAEVEDMPGAAAVAGEHAADLALDALGRGVEGAGVEVALQGDLVAHQRARVGEIHGPVNAESITAGLGHAVEPLAGALGEEHHRHTAAIGLAREALDDALHVAQRELAESPRA